MATSGKLLKKKALTMLKFVPNILHKQIQYKLNLIQPVEKQTGVNKQTKVKHKVVLSA